MSIFAFLGHAQRLPASHEQLLVCPLILRSASESQPGTLLLPCQFFSDLPRCYTNDGNSGHVALSKDGALSLVDNLSNGFDLYNTAEVVPNLSFELPGKQNHVKDATFIEDDSAVACPSESGFIYVFGKGSSKPLQVLRHGCGMHCHLVSYLGLLTCDKCLVGIRRVDAHTSSTRHLIIGASASKKRNEIYIWEKLVSAQTEWVWHSNPERPSPFPGQTSQKDSDGSIQTDIVPRNIQPSVLGSGSLGHARPMAAFIQTCE